MSPDFWAGYISGAAGIVIGNPLDIIKVRLQSGNGSRLQALDSTVHSSPFTSASSLIHGVSAPILGYGALNALLFVTYNRTSDFLSQGQPDTSVRDLWKIWIAGAVGGLATWVISTPSEVVKCRAQLRSTEGGSYAITKEILKREGARGLFLGGSVTALRDSVGYGFYFWSYEWMSREIETRYGGGTDSVETAKVLLCGGLAGVVTWLSVFPLDVVKTRVQTQAMGAEERPLLMEEKRRGAWAISKNMYATEGFGVFWRGFGVCSVRAFIVNATQWAVYEWLMKGLNPKKEPRLDQLVI